MFRLTVNMDADNDGIADSEDNCSVTPNANQADEDGDAIGRACDANLNDGPLGDLDGTGVRNATDNCVPSANASQADIDQDHVGDACDPDVDIFFVSRGDGSDEIYVMSEAGGSQVNLTRNPAFDIMPALCRNRNLGCLHEQP